jgi:dolichol-phosphate mannosyltransferase
LPTRRLTVSYWIIRRIADFEIPPNTGDFRLVSRRVADRVVALDEAHGLLRGVGRGRRLSAYERAYDREARAGGKGKYNRFLGSLVIGFTGVDGRSGLLHDRAARDAAGV